MGIFILARFNFIKCVVISIALFTAAALSWSKGDIASTLLPIVLVPVYWGLSYNWLRKIKEAIKKWSLLCKND
jgi:hypothetical protein